MALTDVPGVPGGLAVSSLGYNISVPYVSDNPPFNFGTSLNGLSLQYFFGSQDNEGNWVIDSSEFDQAGVESLVQTAVTELCELIAAFNQVSVEGVFEHAVISRYWGWSNPELLAAGGSSLSLTDTLEFVPVVPPS